MHKIATDSDDHKIVIRKQARARVRVPDGDYLAQFVGPIREARSGRGIEQDVWLIEPNVVVPLFANMPKGDITPSTKIGQILAALEVPVTEPLCTDTLMGRRCWVQVRTATYTVAYDGDLERRTKVLLQKTAPGRVSSASSESHGVTSETESSRAGGTVCIWSRRCRDL
jgi:hypothetical protein